MGIQTPNLDLEQGLLVQFGGYGSAGQSHQEITVSNATQTLARPSAFATGVLIQAVNASILFTLDGTDPAVEPGFLLPKDLVPLYIPILSENTLRVIRATASDSSVRYWWTRVER